MPTQAQKDVSAAGLFRRFQPRYRTVTVETLSFSTSEMKRGLALCYFWPKSCVLVSHEVYPSINLEVAGVSFPFVYDPHKPDLLEQMEKAVLDAVLRGPFKDREFYIDPADDMIDQAMRQYSVGGSCTMNAKLSHSGDSIPGLTLGRGLPALWSSFIPRESSEGKAIGLAIEVEKAEYTRAQARLLTDGQISRPETLRAQLYNTLAAVPA